MKILAPEKTAEVCLHSLYCLAQGLSHAVLSLVQDEQCSCELSEDLLADEDEMVAPLQDIGGKLRAQPLRDAWRQAEATWSTTDVTAVI